MGMQCMPFNMLSILFSECLTDLAASQEKKNGGSGFQTVLDLGPEDNSAGLDWRLEMPIFIICPAS